MFKRVSSEINNYINDIYELNKNATSINKYYHKIIFNKDKSLITIFENKPYIMLRLSNVSDMPISIYDIKNSEYIPDDSSFHKLNRFNWKDYWENKIDYFEKYIFNKKKVYYSLLTSFNYYIGLAENAIIYVNEIINKKQKTLDDQLVISHRRFTKKMTLIDFYDPTDLIIDHKSRDISEYLKFLFINKDYDINVIEDYLDKTALSDLGAHLLIGRLLYPSFYFDYLEEAFLTNNFNNIYKLEDRKDEYKLFIIEIIRIISKKYQITQIEWLNKKM